MVRSSVFLALSLLLLIGRMSNVESLQQNFYAQSCPGAEATIARIVANAVNGNKRVGAGLTRLLFHDCFVEGCDASVLIRGSNTEIDAIPNLTLHSLDVIDFVKATLEQMCPNTVSCADIVAYAAATSVTSLGGAALDPLGGRFDGLVSTAARANSILPSPFDSLSTIQGMFGAQGLDVTDLVALSGAHTIGKAHCSTFSNRLYNFSSTASTDPTLDPKLASSLKKQCPPNPKSSTVVNFDKTPTVQDNRFFKDVKANTGLLGSDAALLLSPQTKKLVNGFASNPSAFQSQFAASLFKLSQIGVKSSLNGNIRTQCSSPVSSNVIN